MAEVLVLVLSKIGSPLAEKAVSELWGEISKVKVLPRNVAEIRRELRVMKDVILKKGTTYLYDEEHKEWRGWIAEVRTLAYRVEDVMDKYLYYALKLGEEGYVKRNVFKAARYTKAFRGIAQDMADIDRDIKSIAGLLDRWLRPDHFPRPPQHVNASQRPRLFPHLVADEELVGMDAAKKSLEELLYSAENTYVVITVSGMGGLGKTNLVWNMYEREMSKFQEHAWVDAWQNPGSEALLKELVKGIRNQSQPDPDGIDRMLHYKLKQELEEAVAGKRCLIVLDDVQDNEAFNTIHKAFMKVQSGSRIIITTRSRDELAEPAPSRHRIELRPLDNEHARDLFCRLSSLDMQHNCPRVFQDLAGATVEGCGNHSSAIISIAKQLSRESRTEEHWKETCNQFRSVLAKDDIVLRILHRSYYALHEELRNCFLFCSLFPEDYPMSREVLMRLWIAEGFVEAKERNTPEMVAEGYIRKLIQQNMLQPVDTDDFGMVVTCKMHPIMRILALSLSEEIDFGAANDHATMKQLGERVRRLSNCRPREQMLNAIKCLRTLIAVNHNTSASDKCSWIPDKSIYLAVLELQGTTIDTLPDSIGDLFNLRYIGLRKTNVKSLPESIGRLSYLKTLDLKSTYIQKLPRGIKKLKRLRHLFADRCTDKSSSDLQYFKGVAAPNGLSGLEELQIIETVEASNELGKQLEKVEQLSSLSMDNVKPAHCKDLFVSLFKMPRLCSLLFSASDLEETIDIATMEPTSTKIQKLIIIGSLAEGTLRSLFPHHGNNLKHVELTLCRFSEDPLKLLAEHLNQLNHLSLNKVRSTNGMIMVAPADKLPFLRTLLLRNMPEVQQLIIEGGAIQTVEVLYLDNMSSITHVPDGLRSLPSLKKLRLIGLAEEFLNEWYIDEWHQQFKKILDPQMADARNL